MLDEEEYRRWMRASEGALRSAMGDLEREDHNWACFKAHQSGEFERLMAKRDPLAVEALESGAILRDDLKLFEAGGLRGRSQKGLLIRQAPLIREVMARCPYIRIGGIRNTTYSR